MGERPPPRGERLTREHAELVRRFTAEHAWRMIFALEEDKEVSQLRPRTVDRNEVQHEREQWANWHTQQVAAENELIDKTE